MKSTLSVLSCVLFLFAGSISAGLAKPFVVSGNPKAPPVVWEQYDKLTGVGPDLALTILTDLGIDNVLQVTGDWQQVQDKCRNGEVDMIVSAYKNDERASYMLFSIPYMPQPVVIVVKKGREFPFGTWESLIGKKGISNVGESYGQEFDKVIRDKLSVQYMAFDLAVKKLILEEADYLIVDLYTALIYRRLLRGEDAVTILDPAVTTKNFHMTISKKSPLAARLPEIDNRLSQLVKNGTVEKLFNKHFDTWKEKIAKRAAFFNRDLDIRNDEQEMYRRQQNDNEKERIGKLLLQSREGLPGAVD